MKRFLIAGGLDGQSELLEGLRTHVEERRPDGVLFVGGLLGAQSASRAEKVKRWKSCLDGLGTLNVFTAVIPGRSEIPLREFLHLAVAAEVACPNLHIVHATLFVTNNVALCGLGGQLTEADDWVDDWLCYSRASTIYFLRTLWQADQPLKILLLGVAPPGPFGGDAGNPICGDLIDSEHPSLCVVQGSTERRGSQRIAHTLVVNPGRLADGSLAWLDEGRNKNEQVELLGL